VTTLPLLHRLAIAAVATVVELVLVAWGGAVWRVASRETGPEEGRGERRP
jgi:hypothetical protein